ncbi:MAG: hypothetical protein WCY29_12260 [Novosphingobium sp.]
MAPEAAGAERVSCAIAGAAAFTETCMLERTRTEGAPVLVIRHADGGFRRFAVTDGSVTAIDGAQPAAVTRTATGLDVTVGSDRYRLAASQLGHVQ